MSIERPLAKIVRLCEALLQSGINFCHWKSNNALYKSMTGENDLDLLVSRQDIGGFRNIMFSHGLKLMRGIGFKDIPGLEDYFGYDSESGRIFHVQAHYLLVLGHDTTKNIWLPVEAAYLSTVSRKADAMLPTPSAEMELAIFCIRMILKFSLLGVLRGHRELTGRALEEFHDLCARVDRVLLRDLVSEHLPMLGENLIHECIKSLQPGSGIFRLYRINKKIRFALSGYRRVGRLHESVRQQKVRFQLLFGRKFPAYLPNRRPVAGGLMIAIVGGDGAGKSTAISGITKWLHRDFDIVLLHMGKPARTFLSYLMDGLLKFSGLRHRYASMSEIQSFPGYLWMLRSVLYARDRYRCFTRALRMASQGRIIIFDRYYFPTFSTMDGPTCHLAMKYKNNSITARLATWERTYLDRIVMPELMIYLNVSIETAVARKIDEGNDYVRRRNTEICQSDWLRQNAVPVDANRAPQEVLSQIQRVIWSRI
ncbi:MAG: hypothetical protein IT489_01465 [Gammaproteobacteria bacterium]|nr:hypothetical protein [Gammaproteobacteria bacterium]